MHDIIITIGVTFLLLLIIAVVMFLWMFWSTRPLAPISEQEYKRLTDEIDRLKAEEEELRAKVDREWERDKEWNEAINQCKHPRHDEILKHWGIDPK